MLEFFQLLNADLTKYSDTTKISAKFKVFCLDHSFHLVLFIRIGSLVSRIPLFGRSLRFCIEYFIRVFFASDISCKAKIQGGLHIIHGHDIVIGSDVFIGKNCKIFNGVTLGNKYTESRNNDQPRIGNCVVISTGAKILGNVEIGDNSIIGANSVVIDSFGSNSVIVGVPAKKNKSC